MQFQSNVLFRNSEISNQLLSRTVDQSVVKSISIGSDISIQEEELRLSSRELAQKYQGKRIILRKIIEQLPSFRQEEILQIHSQILLDNMQPMKGFLWKAERNGSSIYLIGSCHVGSYGSSVYPYLEKIIETAQFLYCEQNFDLLKEHQDFKKFSENYSVKNQRILALYPAKKENIYTEIARLRLSSYDGFENLLKILATKYSKEFISLETCETSFETINFGFDDYEREKGHHFSFSTEYTIECYDAVRYGNLESIKLLHKEQTKLQIWNDNNRNIQMAAKIVNKLQTGENATFLIGAAHYIGELGIISLLEKENIKITQINL